MAVSRRLPRPFGARNDGRCPNGTRIAEPARALRHWLTGDCRFPECRGASSAHFPVPVPVDATNVCIYAAFDTHRKKATTMRTNIEIDDKLMADALKATGLKTKKEAVDLGLKTLVKLKKQEGIKRFRGKLEWSGDLDDMRRDS